MFDGDDLFGQTKKEIKKEVEAPKPQPARKSSGLLLLSFVCLS